jgi:hypothetical protein
MAMALDTNTVTVTKIWVTDKATVAARKDATTVFRAYLNTLIADGSTAARKDLATRLWLALPHT